MEYNFAAFRYTICCTKTNTLFLKLRFNLFLCLGVSVVRTWEDQEQIEGQEAFCIWMNVKKF